MQENSIYLVAKRLLRGGLAATATSALIFTATPAVAAPNFPALPLGDALPQGVGMPQGIGIPLNNSDPSIKIGNQETTIPQVNDLSIDPEAIETPTLPGSEEEEQQPDPRTQGDEYDPFYDTSTVTVGAPGSVLRTQSTQMAPMPEGLNYPLPSSVTKVLYSSKLHDGTPTAVSGYLVEPSVPWTGKGERPTVVIGRGTVGQGDKCAPSRNWPLNGQPDPISSNRLVALEGLYDWAFAAEGVRVFVTDYVGMGTPGVHTYMNRKEQGHAMLDGARAALNIAAENGESPGKVAFYGHSQGGGASAAAAEMISSYAPELNGAAAYASAPPADLDAVQANIDGSDLVGAIGFTINGLVARYPAVAHDMNAHMSAKGQEVLDDLANMCTDEIVTAYGHQTTSQWTKDGRSLDQLLDDVPTGRQAMQEQFIGAVKPGIPTMVVSGKHDLNVEYDQARNLARNWCSLGGEVIYRDDVLPEIKGYNHLAQAISGAPFGLTFILSKFNDVPVSGSCQGL